MMRIIPIAVGIAAVATAAWLLVPQAQDQRSLNMQRSCFQGFPGLDPDSIDPVEAAEVEQAWNTPLATDLVPVGGLDQRGWARACLDPDDPDHGFEGEYRDFRTWYRGPFALRTEQDGAVPDNALDTYYLSHFLEGSGLILMPLGDPEPPIRRLVLVPVDPTGFAVPEPD